MHWFSRNDVSGKWEPFSKVDSAALEEAHNSGGLLLLYHNNYLLLLARNLVVILMLEFNDIVLPHCHPS